MNRHIRFTMQANTESLQASVLRPLPRGTVLHLRSITTEQLATLFRLTPVQAEHAAIASRELRRALHWHRFFSPTEPNLRTLKAHDAEAGRRACWTGLLYVVWGLLLPEVMAIDPIWSTFRTGYLVQLELDDEPTLA